MYSINMDQLKKYSRANETPFMTKELRKAIMERYRLRDKFLKDKTETNQTSNFKGILVEKF